MAESLISFVVDPDNKFKDAMQKASKDVSDLSIPLTLISREWFKSNRALFALKSPGKFTDLSPSTKKEKEPEVYPILRRSGVLESSITDPTDQSAVSLIINRLTLIMGTKVEYAPFLHFGTKKMPSRPFVMIGAEQTGPEEFNVRKEIWINIIQDYVNKKLAQSTVKAAESA